MVLRALACDVGYHMWLYYLDHFVGNLIRLYDDTGDSVDPEAEHPIRSAYFIWVILRALTNVIESSRHLPEYSTHLQISKPDVLIKMTIFLNLLPFASAAVYAAF